MHTCPRSRENRGEGIEVEPSPFGVVISHFTSHRLCLSVSLSPSMSAHTLTQKHLKKGKLLKLSSNHKSHDKTFEGILKRSRLASGRCRSAVHGTWTRQANHSSHPGPLRECVLVCVQGMCVCRHAKNPDGKEKCRKRDYDVTTLHSYLWRTHPYYGHLQKIGKEAQTQRISKTETVLSFSYLSFQAIIKDNLVLKNP